MFFISNKQYKLKANTFKLQKFWILSFLLTEYEQNVIVEVKGTFGLLLFIGLHLQLKSYLR